MKLTNLISVVLVSLFGVSAGKADPRTSANYSLSNERFDPLGVVAASNISLSGFMPPISGGAVSINYQIRTEGSAFPDSDWDRIPDLWEIDQFGNLDSAAADDHDLDGWNLLEEFALNGDPQDAASGPNIGIEIVQIGLDHFFAFSYTRRRSHIGFSYLTEVSADLASWSDAGLIEHATVVLNSEYERVTVRQTTPIGGREFGRVTVNPAP